VLQTFINYKRKSFIPLTSGVDFINILWAKCMAMAD